MNSQWAETAAPWTSQHDDGVFITEEDTSKQHAQTLTWLFHSATDIHTQKEKEKKMCNSMHGQRCDIMPVIYINQELVTSATLRDISIKEDTIHCQGFQGAQWLHLFIQNAVPD